MAKAPDADHGDPVGGLYTELHNGIEDRDAAAEERSSAGGIQGVRERRGPHPVRTDPRGKSAMTAHDGSLRRGAEVLVS